MGNSITALAPPVRSPRSAYLVKPKPAGQTMIQSLIESIEGLRNALAVRSEQQPPVRYVSSAMVQPASPAPIEVRQVQAPEPLPQKVTVNRKSLLDFFD
ncbi:MAG: hypothetical protein GY845_08720 [Planctomycetes bacterium]|nr:hypothetical protein [Planctomycetota bacterium]